MVTLMQKGSCTLSLSEPLLRLISRTCAPNPIQDSLHSFDLNLCYNLYGPYQVMLRSIGFLQLVNLKSHLMSTQQEVKRAGVLWSVAPNLVLFLFAYTAIGTWLTTSVFGRQLMQLTYTVLQREGDLRFNLVRTRENSGICPWSATHWQVSTQRSNQLGLGL